MNTDTSTKQETAVLIGLINQGQDEDRAREYLNELAFLAKTAGAFTVRKYYQRLDRPDTRTFIGSGKIEEVAAYVKEHKVSMVIFDDELTPTQLRNIERILSCKILDRSNLILDIFANRARTAHARAQVELAQYQYLLPRLTRMWTHLERQRGGIGMRGPGETEIETDRRVIRDKISRLKVKLKTIDKQKATQRKNRGKLVRVALVGYTNVGKSTLMNLLTKSEVFAENKLFATLDTTVRKVVVENLPFLLSDTVGFIRKLPHQLVESFKSTLDEVRESDVLVHVVDISHPSHEAQIEVVDKTLKEIADTDKPTLMVFNKIDQYQPREPDPDEIESGELPASNLEELSSYWAARTHYPCIFISATEKANIPELRQLLYDNIKNIHAQRFPYNHFLY